MTRIRFVTGNAGKLAEAKAALSPLGYEVEGSDARIEEIQADTLADVARDKAQRLVGRVDPPFFVEDAGLFVAALNGFPGVYSAYALRTLGCSGILKLTPKERRAHFGAVIGYVDPAGASYIFEGRVDGRIAQAERGSHGFGFDPIFVPEGHDRTFAEMTADEKNRVSHRGRALKALASHLATAKAGASSSAKH